jgi:UDPglucose--hexose-1-phosphate uridylyltransferase
VKSNDIKSILGDVLLAQSVIQGRLKPLFQGDLRPVLGELQRWSGKVGYFDHLIDKNEYFQFETESLGVLLRLQINYSRLGYKKTTTPDLPDCPLCIENVGVTGKEKLRIFEFSLAGEDVFTQLTPFPLYPGHFVVNLRQHVPMLINRHAFDLASEFLSKAPGFLAASNSDVEWAGASILKHHHLQIFSDLDLPVESARKLWEVDRQGVEISQVCWPSPTLRISGDHNIALNEAVRLVENWKALDPGKATVNFLMRRTEQGECTITIFLRHCNYRTHEELRPIKAEGVGIIEMAGEVIVPPLASLDRSENIDFFKKNGAQLVQDVISQNSPQPSWLNSGWLKQFVLQGNDEDRLFDNGEVVCSCP